jgi:hypothetical protein
LLKAEKQPFEAKKTISDQMVEDGERVADRIHLLDWSGFAQYPLENARVTTVLTGSPKIQG